MNTNLRPGLWSIAVVAASAWQLGFAQAQESLPIAKVGEPTAAIAPRSEPKGGDSSDAAKIEAAVELVQERNASGAVKIEREMTQDASGDYVLHGAWRYYDENGRLIIDGRFVQGQREGLWRRFYRASEAVQLTTAPYKDFSRPLISAATFRAGRMHGTWTITDSQDRKVHEIELDNGERDGPAIWYYPSGGVFAVAHYEHGSPNGEMIQFAADGVVIATETYERGRKISKRTEYHDEAHQVKQEMTFLHSELTSKTPDNWDTLELATFEVRGRDQRHGPYSIWHANGQLARQGEFDLDAPVGGLNAWYSNGQKQLEGTYVDGRQEGVWTWWHANGQKAASGEYHDARPHGKWLWWNATGELAHKTDFSRSRPVVSAAEAIDELRAANLPAADAAAPLRQ
jgi:antitoxin component YwqK of YwqJK toxin-antitoxin module